MKSTRQLVCLLALGVLLLAGCQTTQKTARAPASVQLAKNLALPTTAETLPTSTETAAPKFGGYPQNRSPKQIKILENTGYTVGYCEEMLNPLWVTYYCGQYEKFNSPRPELKFATDKRVSPSARLVHKDFTNPPGKQQPPESYDRGHMAPSFAIGSRYGSEAQKETFTVTNISPQKSCLNQTTWEALEKRIASTYAPESEGVWVIVGPIFGENPSYHYAKPIPIPEAFYCIVADQMDDGSYEALAVIIPQSTTGIRPLRGLETTVREIETLTGLNFFDGLDDTVEARLERSRPGARWDLDSDFIPTRAPAEACR